MSTFRFAMGSDRCTRSKLVARCCNGAFFGFGFVLTVITFAVMFWIAWCYFGLSIVHISDAQRRAVVNYSYTTSKPIPSLTTALPTRSTTSATDETSINSISKLPTTESILRGSSRGESQVKITKKKETSVISSLAKGDFAARDRGPHYNNVSTAFPPKDASASVASPPLRGLPKNKEEPRLTSENKASILSASSVEDSDEDRVHARRVFPPGVENRPVEREEGVDRNRNPSSSEPVPRLDIAPTKAYDTDIKSGSSRVEEPPEFPPRREEPPNFTPREEARTSSRDREKSELPRRDDIQSSRRSEPETSYREPDIDREYPRRSATSSDGGKSRYDDFDDRGSRGRYEKRDRGRESDDRYSKGDTRVYPDDRDLPLKSPSSEDRSRARERHPEDVPKRGDDDRYDDRDRDYEERRSTRDRDRYRDRDLDDRSPLRDDRYRDEDRYRDRDDDRYRDRADERDRSRDDGRIRSRDGDDRYVYRDDDRYRSRDDDRYRTRDDDRYRPRDDDRYNGREEDRYRGREEDRYRTRGDDRFRTKDDTDRRDSIIRPRDEKDEYRPRVDDARYVDSSTSRLRDTESASRSGSSLPVDRKITSSRSEYDRRVEEKVTDDEKPVRDRSKSYLADDVNPSRLSRPPYEEERYRDRDRDDDYRRPSRYEDEVRILPTKTKDDDSYSRSPLIDSRSRDVSSSRYIDSERDRIRDDRYYDQDSRIRGTRIQDSRSPASVIENTRRLSDDDDRYQTRSPNGRVEDPKISERREEVVLDRRSYATERDEEYRRRGSKTDEIYDRDRDRRPVDETRRRYRDDESYTRRDLIDDEDYKRSRTRDDYDRDRSRSRDRYDDEPRRQEDKYSSKGDKSPPLPSSKYDTYPDEDERSRRRSSELSTMRKDDSRDREENSRPSSSARDEERVYSRDEYPDSKSSSRRRYDDDPPLPNSRDFRDDYSDDRRYPRGSREPSKEPMLGSSRTSTINSREPSDIIVREKRFQTADNKQQASRVYGDDESKGREQVRPLSAKDVIEAAIRHSDGSEENARKVFYPVFDPRLANLTSTELIRPGERRGTTITAKKRRSV